MSGNNSHEAVRPVAMTVRLSAPMHELVAREAHLAGVSVNQYVREATLLRVGWGRGRRGEPPVPPEDIDTLRRLLDH